MLNLALYKPGIIIVLSVYLLITICRYEQQVGNLRQQAFNMEQANFAVQSLKDTQSTVVAMKAGVKSMQKEFKKINIDDIEVSNSLHKINKKLSILQVFTL